MLNPKYWKSVRKEKVKMGLRTIDVHECHLTQDNNYANIEEHTGLAQLEEQAAPTRPVEGSSPSSSAETENNQGE